MTLWRKNISEYREALSQGLVEECQKNLKPTKLANRSQSHWKKPKFGSIKMNTDAAWCKSSLRVGVGWVGRDFAGLLQADGGVGNWLLSQCGGY
ncbi:hypothetical protein FF1_043107 [Malus domestica]